MKREQLSHRIGNIEDRLLEQAENAPNFGRTRRNRNIRRTVSVAAVLVLMACSFTIGVFALAKEPEIVYVEVEVEVEVEKEQQIVTIGDSGISLILPDNWKGKYGVEQDGDSLAVYHLATRDKKGYDGVLFWIEYINARYPLDYIYPEPGFTIAITETGTYRMRYTSDVQYVIEDPVSSEEYLSLSREVKTIEIVMSAETLANTTNASNWVEGTAYVEFLDFETREIIKTVDYNAEQSRIIREIVQSQEYALPRVSFYKDIYIMVDGEAYWINSITGDINTTIDGNGNYCAKLSAEDLSRLLEVLNS